jgi:hypothetical protein
VREHLGAVVPVARPVAVTVTAQDLDGTVGALTPKTVARD